MLWNNLVVDIEVFSQDDTIVNVLVRRGRDLVWLLTTIYASLKLSFHSVI